VQDEAKLRERFIGELNDDEQKGTSLSAVLVLMVVTCGDIFCYYVDNASERYVGQLTREGDRYHTTQLPSFDELSESQTPH